MKFDFKIREIKQGDREWIKKFIAKNWGSEKIVSRGPVHFPHKLPGFVAVKSDEYLGLITYKIKKILRNSKLKFDNKKRWHRKGSGGSG